MAKIENYAQFRYSPSDEEIRAAYGHILNLFPDNFTDTDYREEIALLMAQINKLLSPSDNEDIGISRDQWQLVLETIKLKATLIKEQRLHKIRLEKLKLDKAKVDVIPKEEFAKAVGCIVTLIKDYISPELIPSFMQEISSILAKTTGSTIENVNTPLSILEDE